MARGRVRPFDESNRLAQPACRYDAARKRTRACRQPGRCTLPGPRRTAAADHRAGHDGLAACVIQATSEIIQVAASRTSSGSCLDALTLSVGDDEPRPAIVHTHPDAAIGLGRLDLQAQHVAAKRDPVVQVRCLKAQVAKGRDLISTPDSLGPLSLTC